MILIGVALVAIGFELLLPPASRTLIDTVARGPAHAPAGWQALLLRARDAGLQYIYLQQH